MTPTESLAAEVRRILELEKIATPGPWRVEPQKGYTDDYIVTLHPDFAPDSDKPWRHYIGETGHAGGKPTQNFSNDAALIAALRNLAPRLALLESALKVCEAAEKCGDRILDWAPLREALAAHHALLDTGR